MTDLPAATVAPLAAVIDLAAHRAARKRSKAEPVRYITPEFVAAMQGSWGELRPYAPRAIAQR